MGMNKEFDNFIIKRKEEIHKSITKFMSRILGMPEDIGIWKKEAIEDIYNHMTGMMVDLDVEFCDPFYNCDNVPCYKTDMCKVYNCPFKK